MKKFICVFPIIVLLLFGNLTALTASAVTFESGCSEGTCAEESQFVYKSLSSFQNTINSENPYFYIQWSCIHPNESNSIYYANSAFFHLPSDEVIVEDADGIYTFTFTTLGQEYVYFAYNSYKIIDGVADRLSGVIVSRNNYKRFAKMIYNSNTKEAVFYNDADTVVLRCYGSTVKDVQTTFTDLATPLDLSVSFTPSLVGEVDRKVEQNGVLAESNYFSMSVKNNSRKNAQFFMCIAPTGTVPTFTSASVNTSGLSFSENPIFYFMKKQWTYAPIIQSNISLRKGEKTYYQASPWHVVKGGATYTQSFKWSQVNIQKDVTYDVIVLALPNDWDKSSTVFNYSENAHYIDVSMGVEVYRGSFHLSNPPAYDSSDTEFDNVSNTGGMSANQNLNKAEGYLDENGEAVIKDLTPEGVLSDRQEWTPGTIEKHFDDVSLEQVKELFSQCTGFLSFLSVVFAFLPLWFWALVFTGLTSMLVIGIFKLLK